MRPPGMKLDARYTAVGQALQRSPNWAEVGKRLAGLNADLEVSLHGPFDELNGSAAVIGEGVSLNARALPRRHFELDLRFDKLETGPLIPASQRDLLGGRLDGRLAVSAKLGPRSMDTSVSVDHLELDLLRHRQAAGPRRIVISHGVGQSSSNDVRIGLGVIALEREVLRVASLRVRGPGVRLDTSLRAERQAESGAFLFQATTQPASQATLRGETFVLPPLVRVRFQPGRSVAVQPFSIDRVGGGAIDVGRIVAARRLGRFARCDSRLSARPHPGPRARCRRPGRRRRSRVSCAGSWMRRFDSPVSTAQPRLSGELATTGVRWAGRRLGDGHIVFQGVAGGTRFEGALMDGVDVNGQLHRRARRDDFVGISLARPAPRRLVAAAGCCPRPARVGERRRDGAGARAADDGGRRCLDQRNRRRAERACSPAPGAGHGIGARAGGSGPGGCGPAEGKVSRVADPQRGRRDHRRCELAGRRRCNGGGLWPYARYPGRWRVSQARSRWPAPVAVVCAAPDPITVAPTRIELGGSEVRVPGVEVHFGGDVRATVAGRIHDIDWSHPDDAVARRQAHRHAPMDVSSGAGSATARPAGEWLASRGSVRAGARAARGGPGELRQPDRELASLAGRRGARERTGRDRWSRDRGRASRRWIRERRLAQDCGIAGRRAA